jgi:hypothetical protein
MSQILGEGFGFIRGIYYKIPIMNVIWALNNAQHPIAKPENDKITEAAFRQITNKMHSSDIQLVITSSSSGSIVAAQTACYLAEKNRDTRYFKKPFHMVLGASMISPESGLFRKLEYYQKEGLIGTIIHDEIQDEGDTSAGIGGLTRREAYCNAFGLLFPWFSGKFKSPSFLNTHPVNGHVHRRRAMTLKKALDYMDIILIKHRLAGDYYMKKAVAVLQSETD